MTDQIIIILIAEIVPEGIIIFIYSRHKNFINKQTMLNSMRFNRDKKLNLDTSQVLSC